MRYNTYRRLFVAVAVMAAALFAGKAGAQLQITAGSSLGNWTPDSLVRNVMLGEGVEIYNVKFNGSLTSINCNGIGRFTTGNTSTNLGMDAGIILSASGMDYISTTNGSSTHNCPSVTDSNLASVVAPKSINNCAILEFDFVPRSDSIKFRYVFASEEYFAYECTQFNDVFAFFLTGINPFGGMYNNKNIAVVPGTDTPITISTVNGGVSHGSETPCVLTNTQYFVDNSSTTYIKHMDGFTTVMTAEAKVVPCATYHLKMGVANVSDQSLPSCVFLEANSLSSNAIQFSFNNSANPGAPSDLYEGCEAKIIMVRPNQSSTPTRIDIEVEGDVSNGVDFPVLNPYIYFPANTDSLILTLAPYMDGIDEGVDGVEYAKIVLSPANGCVRSDSVEFNIIDTDPIGLHIEHDTLYNSVYTTQLHAVVTGGMPNRTVTWTNLTTGAQQTGEVITVTTIPYDVRYAVVVEDACFNIDFDTILVGIRHHFAFPSSDTVLCSGEPLSLSVRGADSCVWSVIGGAEFAWGDTAVTVYPDDITFYAVRSYIWWNGQYWEDNDTIRVVVVSTPSLLLNSSSTRICEGQSVTINASGTNQYSWDGGETFVDASSHTYMPDSTTTYVIYGLSAGAECYGRDSLLIVVDTIPDIYLGDGGGVCGGEEAELTVTTSAESFTWSAQPPDASLGGQEEHNTIIVNPDVTTVYTVHAVNGVCTNDASTTVAVEPPPVAIGEVSPRTVSLGNMEAIFTDVSENATSRRWELPDGVVKTERQISYIVPDDVDSVNVRLWAYNPYLCFDTTTITVFVDHTTLWAPNAFTPDESTNRTFLIKVNDVQRYHLFIYDRRGALVFESLDPDQPWDGTALNGKKCPQGVYTYLVSCHKITYPYDQLVYKGTVVLLR